MFHGRSAKVGLRGVLLLLALCLALPPAPARASVTTNLKVAYVAYNPPMQFLGPQGEAQGMHVDILKHIAEQENFNLTFIPVEHESNAFEMLFANQADIVLGAMVGRFKDDEKVLNTSEMFSTTISLIAPNSVLTNGELNKSTPNLAAIYEFGSIRQSIMGGLGARLYYAVSNQEEVLKTHSAMPKSLMLGAKESLLYQIHRIGADSRYTILNNHVSNVSYSIAVRAGDSLLHRQLERALVALRGSPEYENIFLTWTLDPTELRNQRTIQQILLVAAVLLLTLIAYAIVTQRVRALLLRKVREQTNEIRTVNIALEANVAKLEDLSGLQQRLIEFSPSGMVLMDKQRNIRLMNASALKLVGLEQVPTGMPVSEVPLLNDLLANVDTAQPDFVTHGLSWTAEADPGTQEEGGGRTFRCNLHATTAKGEVDGALMTLMDVTAEEQQRQLAFEDEKTKAISRLVAGIAHEIKNPLTSIRTFARLMEMRKGDQQVQEQFAEFVPGEVERINRLIESLINYSRPTRKNPQRTNVKSAVTDCLYLAKVVNKEDITIHTDLDESLFIHVDQDQFKQVLINLMVNAIESMEKKLRGSNPPTEPMQLRITADAWQDRARVMVEDTGLGMSAKQLSRCTDPFFTTKSGGTGLGLALSRSYVEENGGSMHIESQEGVFSRVTIDFPRIA